MYYKALTRDMKSAMVSDRFSVTYSMEKWVEPKIGKLFVFNCFKNAKLFIANIGWLNIWECEVINPVHSTQFILRYLANDLIQLYWIFNVGELTFPPKGTVLCDAVKLIRRI